MAGECAECVCLVVVSALVVLVALPATAAHLLEGANRADLANEEAIMLKLRQALLDVQPVYLAGVLRTHIEPDFGWAAGSSISPCDWSGVQCNAAGHVTLLEITVDREEKCNSSGWTHSSAQPGLVLPADLAQLRWLNELHIRFGNVPLQTGIPAEWGYAGAFPRLIWLHLVMPCPPAAVDTAAAHLLPDIQPGALPSLATMTIQLKRAHVVLPPSWGSHPGVLPKLQALQLTVRSVDRLPASWASGFRSLEHLEIRASSDVGAFQDIHLPPEWASSFPLVHTVGLSALGIAGSLPTSWLASFPRLKFLDLSYNGLTGTLPADLFEQCPTLKEVGLHKNRFFGTLPWAWANSGVVKLDVSHNELAGAAFPPAWTQPGTLPLLRSLSLSQNAGLNGSLPSMLPWPMIQHLDLSDTGVGGSIPAAWCQAPCAKSLEMMWINDTAISHSLPQCAEHAMPQLVLDFLPNISAEPAVGIPFSKAAHDIAGAAQGWQHSALVAGAVMLALAIAAGAAMVTLVLLWNKSHQQNGMSGLHSAQTRISPETRQKRQQAQGVGGMHGTLQDYLARLTDPLSQVVDSEIDDIEMLRLAPTQQPAGAARHYLETATASGPTVTWSSTVVSSSSSSSRLGVGELQCLLSAVQSLQSGTEGSGSSPFGSGIHGASEHLLPTGSLFSQPWGMQTESLRLTPHELQFAVDASSGSYVELGRGKHGLVLLAKLRGQLVAAKVFELVPGVDPASIWRELSLMRLCSHPCIVPLYGVVLKGPLLVAAMQLMERGSLRDALQNPQTCTELVWSARGCQVALDVAEALAYLHAQLNIMHSDLKAANVLLSSGWRAHLSDLGVAQVLQRTEHSVMGLSRMYCAPEQLMGKRCTMAADMYSFGILLIELTTLTLITRRGDWRLPQAPEECPEEVVSLIRECVSHDPLQRPTAAQVLQRLKSTMEA